MPPTKKSFRKRIIYQIARCLPARFKLSDLETIADTDLADFGEMSVIPAFQKTARTLPFYKKILAEKGVAVAQVRTLEDFSHFVPIIKKDDIFPIFSASDICQDGKINDMRSAIVTSGTSGIFAYGLLTNKDAAFQQKMIDEFFNYYFNAKNESVLIINALAMGVSFSSSYPVISTSVRPDIVIHLIKTFHDFYERIVIVCDPNFAKKIIDDGSASAVSWKETSVSFVAGGAWFSNSLAHYILSCIENSARGGTNAFLGTMGLTEIALNIFTAPSELIALRNILQNDKEIMSEVFGINMVVCPEVMYYYPTRTYIEIVGADSRDVGNIVISNLDTKSKTPLFRYDTADKGKLINKDHLMGILKKKGYDISLKLHLPLIAIFEREENTPDGVFVSVPEVKEALFQIPEIVPSLTGHFRILKDTQIIEVQLEKNVQKSDLIKMNLETRIRDISGKQMTVILVPYHDFAYDMDLNYEKKWKHIS